LNLWCYFFSLLEGRYII